MTEPAVQILEKLCKGIYRKEHLSYFITDKKGALIQWGGNLSLLNITVPDPQSHIADIAGFMEGILPLKGQTMEFSCIQMKPGVCVDALLFKIDTGYGLIIWDAGGKEACLTKTQQQCNELSLLIEEQKNKIFQSRPATVPETDHSFMEDLFLALNYAVLEMDDHGHFVLLGTPPMWISQLPQSGRLLSGQTYEDDVFGFLGNFIQEAKTRWQQNASISFKSGIWIEKDASGKEFIFEATGVCVQGKKLLIIANNTCPPDEKPSIIQKEKDQALHYHDLQDAGLTLENMRDTHNAQMKEKNRDPEQTDEKAVTEPEKEHPVKNEREAVADQLHHARKMQAVGTLAGGIAHDFNNILSTIMGYTGLSILEAGDDNPLKPNLDKILKASEQAMERVRQILSFSRQTEYEKQPLRLKLLIHEALDQLKASFPASIEIKTHLVSDAYILADPARILQMIMNLCTNARDAMHQDGGTLSIELEDMDITEKDLSDMPELSKGRHLVLSVKDSGCGIQPDLLDQIFDPYFTTKSIDKGAGLGLSVVHGIVGDLNGCIQAFSEKDKGSQFKIYLPAFDSHAGVKTEKKSLPHGNQEHILFVDDEVFQTRMAEELLNRLGYQVTTCNNGAHALELFDRDKNPFQLVIADIVMPGMSGKTLAGKMHGIRPEIPIILCSGCSDEIDPETLKDLGVFQHLMKPVNMETLANTIKDALQTS